MMIFTRVLYQVVRFGNRQITQTHRLSQLRRLSGCLPQSYLQNPQFHSLGMSPQTPLDFNSGPMVWIDCEMTGLDPRKDKILEIAVLITNGDLELVDEQGIQFVIRTDKAVLNSMDEWCITQHGKARLQCITQRAYLTSGLTQACMTSPHTREYVAKVVLEYIKKWVPQKRTAVLAGNSVHADRSFLVEEMPEVIDLASLPELCRRWFPDNQVPKDALAGKHRALDDIMDSIQELSWYRQNIFVQPSRKSC
ncbi:ribonuclease H-like domain-containing protein [Suillus subalutaceus]|uniref:ribonuclease H-like domain-containing protein n=1 Tax=Suillus subalutaceus TaxID=48586 RepID=UPI001B87F300|nr:ribonuclease H-like domain-containing protein [Suillus subalutaceus]KAG1854145.1 ribonuclease H-like domain-containing protein [Suillus subalutaceus]